MDVRGHSPGGKGRKVKAGSFRTPCHVAIQRPDCRPLENERGGKGEACV